MDVSGRAGIETLMLEQLQRPSVMVGFCFWSGGEWQWVGLVGRVCGCVLLWLHVASDCLCGGVGVGR
jgi:hypothetical protein